MRVAHVSDPHFGRIACEHVEQALLECIVRNRCDMVLVTGDLTQRARVSEFKDAGLFLNRLPVPYLVIPGNHDVHAWWHRPDLRLFNPLKRYKKMISEEIEPMISQREYAILGLNSAHGLTIKGGRCTSGHLRKIREFFSQQSSHTFKILAIHHPISLVKSFNISDVARRGNQVLDVAAQSGVDVICAGHWHLSHVSCSDINGSHVHLSIAGTVTSDRWRPPQMGLNSWNLIVKSSEGVDIQVHQYQKKTRTFNKLS
ncbi:MAG: metallophosphoesterase [Bacteroidetes bacterium]|nr:metallophosphoesterase [Bacteroidota bacterium]